MSVPQKINTTDWLKSNTGTPFKIDSPGTLASPWVPYLVTVTLNYER
jgi:hypothetical protein